MIFFLSRLHFFSVPQPTQPAFPSLPMPDAFFSRPSSSKRKRPGKPTDGSAGSGGPNGKLRSAPPKKKRDEELSDDGSDIGIDDMDFRRDTRGGSSDEEEAERAKRETGNEKRLRLAREYLKNVEQELGLSFPLVFIFFSSAFFRLPFFCSFSC